MVRSYTGRRRFRKSFGRVKEKTQIPNLIALQKSSFDSFLQCGVPSSKMENTGLVGIFNSFFPIKDTAGKAQLDFCGYSFDDPKYTEIECRQRGGTYSSAIRGKFRLVIWDVDLDTGARTIKDIKEQDVYLGDFPLMTDRGTFIFNGIERVVVSQMHRSPGVFIDHDQGKTHASGKFLFAARIIPYRGSWLEFEIDEKKKKNDISAAQVKELFGKIDALTNLVEKLGGEAQEPGDKVCVGRLRDRILVLKHPKGHSGGCGKD